ncbi:MAG: hypothetical protein JXB60_01700 [Candidatus Cloacimonetes bacterium]|nr:hypothetical protein [Candidatus Cloacimonadota bacterium]
MKNKPQVKKNSPILTSLINALFDIIKHFIKDLENIRKVKKIDRFSEEFSTLEHLMLKLEKKMDENRYQIDDLKTRILWGNIVIIVLLLLNLFHIIR